MARKILIFSLAYYPKHIGGAEVAIKEITDRFDKSKYEFHLLCNRYDSTLPKTEQIGNVLVHRIGLTKKDPTMSDLKRWPLHLNKLLYQFLAFYKAIQLHKEYQYDGVWAMMAHATGVPAARFKKKFPEVKYLLTLQEGDPPEYIEKKMRWFGQRFKDAFSLADKVQVISNFLGAWAKRQGYQGEPVLVPNAVNVKHFSQEFMASDLDKVRQELGRKSVSVFLVTTSRLVPKNGVDSVIEALVSLPRKVEFIVFGIGPEEENLMNLAKHFGVEERVHFLGQIDHEVMPKYLKACDIFIRPSRSEGMGNSFIEAMAAGLPVIATQEGGIADFLFDAQRNPDQVTTGWAVDKDSPEQIERAVLEIGGDPTQTELVVSNAKRMVVNNYDWKLIAERMETQVFDTLFS